MNRTQRIGIFVFICLITVYLCPANLSAQARIVESIFYKVKANGKPILVYDSPIASFAMIDITKEIKFEIQAGRDVKWVDIRPFNSGLKAEWKDSVIHFTVNKPCKLSLELNGEALVHPLFLFISNPETEIPDKKNPAVIYFGGGGLKDGGIIKPKSGQKVYIEAGTIVEGIIEASGVENVQVCGRGILLGPAKKFDDGLWHKMIEFKDSKNISIHDISIVDSHLWQIVPINCENVAIDNIKIISDNGSDDGIDICRSRQVKITNSFIRAKDDCIAIKGNFEYQDSIITSGIEISNCVLWNAAWGNGVDVGFELQCAEVKNIYLHDCDFIHVDKGATISIHNGDKACVSNLLFENIRIEDSNQKLFDLAVFYNQYAIDKPKSKEKSESIYLNGAWDGVLYLNPQQRKEHARFRGSVENITFRNIFVNDGIFPFSLFCGYDENHKVKNITIENLQVHGRKINSLSEARIYQEFAEGINIK